MSKPHSHSWSRVVLEEGEAAPPDSRRQEFRWKTVKKGRLRPSAPQPTDYHCHGEHCYRSLDRCTRTECVAQIDREIDLIDSEIDALGAEFAERLYHIDKLNSSIRASCNMDNYYSSENEESSNALVVARQAKAPTVSCRCPSCKIAHKQNVRFVLSEKLSAAQLRLEVLGDYRVAHEKEPVEWTGPPCVSRKMLHSSTAMLTILTAQVSQRNILLQSEQPKAEVFLHYDQRSRCRTPTMLRR